MLVNTKEMLVKAKHDGYAVPQINVNNLEWAKSILMTAKESRSPVILGFTEGAVKYQGGWHAVVGMVKGLLIDLEIDVPVAIHLDHGTSFEVVKEAISAGFTSVMYDGSHHPIDENVKVTTEVVNYAHERGVTVEAEVGVLGGNEDGIAGESQYANPEEVKAIAATGIDMLATAVGNAHGLYKGEVKLSFELVEQFSKDTGIPLVLHGGTGIPLDQVQKVVNLGMSKVNVNTELQVAFAAKIREYIEAEKDLDKENAGFDPRKVLAGSIEAIKEVVKQKFIDLGSAGKA